MNDSFSAQIARGKELTRIAQIWGVERESGEADASLRDKVGEAIRKQHEKARREFLQAHKAEQ